MSFEVPCCHIVLGTMRTLHETLHPLSQPHYYRSCRCRLAARWAPACTELRRRERAVERHRLARWDGGSAPFAGGASVLPRSCAAAAAAAGTPTIFRRWVGRTHGPYACRTHVLRAPGADPGHPGGRVVAASDQYVSTTAIVISRGPQLGRKAVLLKILRGVEDVLWRT